jgi:hypothetical protein
MLKAWRDFVQPLPNSWSKRAFLGSSCFYVNTLANRSQIDCEDLPRPLIQTLVAIDALPLESKKVDYGIYMVLNASRMNQIESFLASVPDISAWTIGQSNTPWLRTKPSLVSIQMKTSVSPEDSLIQLAIWCSAGLQALSNIVDEEVVKPEDIPSTFTVSIKGHSCRLGYKRLESSTDTYLPKEGKHSSLSIFLLLTALVYVEILGD